MKNPITNLLTGYFILQLITVIGWAGADVHAASETNLRTSDNIIWYRQPAEDWVQALPVGNGRLGAMVFGNVKNEHIQLNDDSIFAGQPVNRNNPKALENLWQYFRSHYWSNQTYDDYDDLREAACAAWQKSALNSDLIKSVCWAEYAERYI